MFRRHKHVANQWYIRRRRHSCKYTFIMYILIFFFCHFKNNQYETIAKFTTLITKLYFYRFLEIHYRSCILSLLLSYISPTSSSLLYTYFSQVRPTIPASNGNISSTVKTLYVCVCVCVISICHRIAKSFLVDIHICTLDTATNHGYFSRYLQRARIHYSSTSLQILNHRPQ